MGWLANWRRKRVLEKHRLEEGLWRSATKGFGFIQALSKPETEKLKQLVLLFLAEKQFSGARGIQVSDAMRVSIAAQACLPILELGLDWYAGWTGIVLYPGDFRVRRSELDEDGVLHEWDDELAGEAVPGGPVVLSWDAATDVNARPDARPLDEPAMNVVIHEFAHKLDMLSGAPNGVPPLHPGMDRRAWLRSLDDAFEGFCDALERGKDTWLDPYAAEHPSEFFAVMSEAFFQEPKETQRRYPDFYEQLKLFYRQDPALRDLNRKTRG
jgi:Mlc titration factor MtfA (ptsG expression regulator)